MILRGLTFVCCAAAAFGASSPSTTEAAPPTAARGLPATPDGPAIDAAVSAMWAKAGVHPAPEATPGAYLRRVTIDLAGRVPTRAEVAAYRGGGVGSEGGDIDGDDKAALVDRLLASADFAEHWADVYEGLLVGRAAKLRADGRSGVHTYLADAFAKDLPYDQLTHQILEADGSLVDHGEGGFVAAHLFGGGSPEALAGATARIFLGLQIQCAQCHDHPYDTRTKQEDFWGFAAFFARTKARPFDMTEAEKEPTRKTLVVFDVPQGQAIMKKHGSNEDVVVAPRFLGRDPAHAAGEGRRPVLAREIVASNLFAKALVNRTWAELFGRGIVDPWDDLGGETDEQPPLLELLAADTVAKKYDFKALVRAIVLSKAYGLASSGGDDGPGGDGAKAEAVFARAAVRPLLPEALFRSLVVASGIDEVATRRLSHEQVEKKLAQGLKQFVYVFGDDEMGEVDRGSGTVQQALLLLNGDLANRGAKAAPGGVLRAILDESKDPSRRLDAMFAAAFARTPTDAERARLVPALREPGGYEDVYFAMLTSTEFTTIH
jgi:Protein of unknown function (DUF1549)/Protein of unknown function (DUF1553)